MQHMSFLSTSPQIDIGELGPYFSHLYVPVTGCMAPCVQELLREGVVCE